MSAELEARIKKLEREIERMRSIPLGPKYGDANIANPPITANITGLLGANSYPGIIGVINDNNAHANVWLVVNIGGVGYYVALTQAAS